MTHGHHLVAIDDAWVGDGWQVIVAATLIEAAISALVAEWEQIDTEENADG